MANEQTEPAAQIKKEQHPLTRYLPKYGEGSAEINGYLVQVQHDDMAQNPRAHYDHPGTLVIFPNPNRYRRNNYSYLSDKGYVFGNNWSVQDILYRMVDYDEYEENQRRGQDMPEEWHKIRSRGMLENRYVYIGIEVRDYGSDGLKIYKNRDEDEDEWDGILYIQKSYAPGATDEQREEDDARLMRNLQAELEELNHWFQNDVYGFTIEKDGEDIDSCWGFYGNHDTSGLFDCIMHTVGPLTQTTQEEPKNNTTEEKQV